MLLLCSYYVRTIQLRKGGVLMGAAPQQGREGAAPPPRCLISQRYSSLPSSSYTDNQIETHTNREYRGKKRKGNKRKEENSRKTPSKSLDPILR